MENLEGIAAGRYKILKRIGEGGSGQVFRAKDRETATIVALKVYAEGSASRFLREAAVVAEIDHPHIVRVRDHGVHNGRPYLVMDFVEGVPLFQVLRRGPLPEKAALRIGMKLAETLGFLHSRNIIHRDLKPSNIMLKKGGEPVIVDFGFMKSYADDYDLLQVGSTLGTPAYMAPELVEGDLDETDERTDIFSLGAVIYEMLSGERAFPAPDPERVFRQILRMRPTPPKELRPDLSGAAGDVCMKALAKDPSSRYATAKDLANALGRILLTGRN